MFTNWY